MSLISVGASAVSSAEPGTIFALLADGSSWPQWSPIRSYELADAAADGGEGVGAVRAFNSGLTRSLEQVVLVEHPTEFRYRLLSSRILHVRDYEAAVRLTTESGGTRITWTGSFRPLFPFSGWLWKRIIAGLYGQFVDGLAAYAAEEGVGQ